MSAILKKTSADKMAFKHHPKSFNVATSVVASEFVAMQAEHSSDFQIADVVAAQSGVEALRKKNLESQVEGSVLERLKEIEEQAYAKAYELGLREGTEKAFKEKHDEFSDRLQKLDQFLVNVEHLKINSLKENETAFIKLVFQLAEKIALREVTLSHEPVLELLTKLVAELQGAESVTIKMNPDDFNFIEDLRAKNVKEIERLAHVKLLSAENIEMGGCVIETNFGEIDATVSQRVEKAWQILAAKLPIIKKQDASSV